MNEHIDFDNINYSEVFAERARRYNAMNNDHSLVIGAKEYYKTRPAEFINDWGVTYNPKLALTDKPTTMPFVLFPRQAECIDFVMDCIKNEEDGTIEKCRDAGITELMTQLGVWFWLFIDGSSLGFGSRKELLVDRIGDPDSIFEKIRIKIRYIPKFFLPQGFNEKDNFNFLKIISPNGNTITGEAGDDIGRGGRKMAYIVDESAHCQHQEMIDAALKDNTNTQIHVSSVLGQNLFYRRGLHGRKFVFDWRDDPRKNQEWYDKRKKEAENKGVLPLFFQEVDRNYQAAVEGLFIDVEWLQSCIDAHIALKWEEEGIKACGFDVADEGGDKNATVATKGSVVQEIDLWTEGDTTQNANKVINYCERNGIKRLIYDAIGAGAGTKGESKRIEEHRKEKEQTPLTVDVIPFKANNKCKYPEKKVDGTDIMNKDFFYSKSALKGQAWWEVRMRAFKTHRAVTGLQDYPQCELLSIPSNIKNSTVLVEQLGSVKIVYMNGAVSVETKEQLRKRGISSPDVAEACVQAYCPGMEKKKPRSSFF